MSTCCNINETIQDFYDALFAYALTKVEDKEQAEDIVQEVMYRFAKAYQNNTEIQHLRGWLYQTTRHVIADHFRSLSPSSEFTEQMEIVPDEPAEFELEDELIAQMIKLLPEEYSIPLLWSDIDNVPQKEIAGKLGLKLSATKMRIQRARKMLHEMFLECCEIVYDKNGNFVHCDIKNTCTPLLEIEKKLTDNQK